MCTCSEQCAKFILYLGETFVLYLCVCEMFNLYCLHYYHVICGSQVQSTCNMRLSAQGNPDSASVSLAVAGSHSHHNEANCTKGGEGRGEEREWEGKEKGRGGEGKGKRGRGGRNNQVDR